MEMVTGIDWAELTVGVASLLVLLIIVILFIRALNKQDERQFNALTRMNETISKLAIVLEKNTQVLEAIRNDINRKK